MYIYIYYRSIYLQHTSLPLRNICFAMRANATASSSLHIYISNIYLSIHLSRTHLAPSPRHLLNHARERDGLVVPPPPCLVFPLRLFRRSLPRLLLRGIDETPSARGDFGGRCRRGDTTVAKKPFLPRAPPDTLLVRCAVSIGRSRRAGRVNP